MGNAFGKRLVSTLGETGVENDVVVKPKDVAKGCDVCLLSGEVVKGVLLVSSSRNADRTVDGVGSVRRQLSCMFTKILETTSCRVCDELVKKCAL